MLEDRYGLSLSTSSALARDAYGAAVDCILSGGDDPQTQLTLAIQADPAFALAHIAQARSHLVRARQPQAREAAAQARALAHRATPREQSHIHALALAIEGKAADSLTATYDHLKLYPRDAMVLAPATTIFGLIGLSGRAQRVQEQLVLMRSLATHYLDDWWFVSMLAFAICESGQLDEAHDLIDQSLAAYPRNAHGAHVYAHVLYEKRQAEKASTYLNHWMSSYPKQGLLHCHLSWHLALLALELGETERAWAIYQADIHPGGAWGPPLNIATDAPSFLWRAELAGQAQQSQRWPEVHQFVASSFSKVGLSFSDVHFAVACAAVHDVSGLDQLIEALHQRQAKNELLAGPVVLTLAQAYRAFEKTQWDEAIRLFEEALPDTARIGGSLAQRDLIENTLLAAYLKAGRADEARQRFAHSAQRQPFIMVNGLSGA